LLLRNVICFGANGHHTMTIGLNIKIRNEQLYRSASNLGYLICNAFSALFILNIQGRRLILKSNLVNLLFCTHAQLMWHSMCVLIVYCPFRHLSSNKNTIYWNRFDYYVIDNLRLFIMRSTALLCIVNIL
jgi:hypothetical protein